MDVGEILEMQAREIKKLRADVDQLKRQETPVVSLQNAFLLAQDGRIGAAEAQLAQLSPTALALAAYHAAPLLFPNLRAAWLMNQWAPGLVYDATSQGRHMTTHGTLAFNQQNTILRYLGLDGSSTYLSRVSEAGLEITNSLSVMAWAYKGTSGTQFIMLAKTSGLPASTNQAFFFTVGSSNNLNLTVCNGTTNYNQTIAAPIGEWFFGAGSYSPSANITLYLGTQDGWQTASNTTGIPASINNPTTIALTIGATHGGANFGDGRIAMAALMNSGSNETLFRNYFEFTKGLFYGFN